MDQNRASAEARHARMALTPVGIEPIVGAIYGRISRANLRFLKPWNCGLCFWRADTSPAQGVWYWVCAVIRRRFPVGASPTRQTLQPKATGAAKEVTNWLKPSECVSRIGDSASVQAATRVNAEQTSKRTMRRPTRQPFRGRLIRLGD